MRLQAKLSRLQAQQTSAASNSTSVNSKLERTILQLEDARTANAELERVNDDLKRSHSELKRQLDKWQHLETKGEVAAEDLRQRRVALELEVKELENKLVDAELLVADAESGREKEKKRVEKAKAAYHEWKVHFIF
jgi:chromosome segregation ATPase